MRSHIVEAILGAIVLLVSIFFIVLAWQATVGTKKGAYYTLTARFNSIGDLNVGAPVKIGGYIVGNIASVSIDPNTYQVITTLNITKELALSNDSVAKINSSGLLGKNFVDITPGHSGTFIKQGGLIIHTKDVFSLEDLLGSFLTNLQS